ncbi:membrane morphogenesis protein VPS13 NDAI_0D04940 [Naumovozyma dairenensis CBS 421]|uniref:Vacuolar protein sorting-associated protein n=1 Tax=Naumovozyma dairenensis (strain ATCC 10597 / BCRC 20456 / CBS 421 / NBRC 0211 / NRRL Y-12639) TaxID=1071378 RepID=G0WAJ6_NAUDC|nr:hypothetical protein NDAI_0D04940 [Naumovozyma dairenensis CBS 421]CCD24807.1 hypothetical protein NDAI_0D04940 [Naumovozyma dairenensis CBS 421]
MLESLATTLLNRLLGSYVENFDPAQLKMGIWSGDARLENLKLRKDCLDRLELPIDVKYGVLGKLILNVSWSNLKNKPVKISIEDCYFICSPRTKLSYNTQEQIERDLRLKLSKLAEWELANRVKSSNDSQPSSSSQQQQNNNDTSFTQSLVTKIIDNLQVTIKNIHIRYEDMDSVFSKDPCAFGLTLKQLSAVSTNEDWEPSFIELTQIITHKLLTLDSFSAYWNTNATSLLEDEMIPEITFENLKSEISNNTSTNSENNSETDNQRISYNEYLLNPIDAEGKLIVNKAGTTKERPHTDLELSCNEFGVSLNDSVYASLLYSITEIHLNSITQKYKVNRPEYSVDENPSGWFKYTALCILQEIKEKKQMWTWDNIKKKGEQRRAYVDLWIEKLKLKSIDNTLPDMEKENQLQELHKQLNYDEIVMFRLIAKRRYAKEKLENADSGDSTAVTDASHGTKGRWISSWWSGNANEPATDLIISEEEKKELYDTIDFKENQTPLADIQIPRDWTTFKLTGILNKGFFAIKRQSFEVPLGEIIFENCELNFLQRLDSFKTSFKLQEFKLKDGSPNTLYKYIISAKDITKSEDDSDNEESSGQPLLDATFESNPLDGIAHSNLNIKLRGMTIFYHVHFLTEVINFFTPPKQHLESMVALLGAAESTIGWTNQSRMGIETILEEHKTVNLMLDLQSPLVVVPLDPHVWETPCAIIDAGHISVASQVVPKNKINELKDMEAEEYERMDANEISRLMYDRFKVSSQDTQVIIGSNLQSLLSSLNDQETLDNLNILKKMSLDIILDTLILGKALQLPKLRLSGHLPKLLLSLNDYQYKMMLQLLDKCVLSLFDYNKESDYTTPIVNVDDVEAAEQSRLNDSLQALSTMSELEILQKMIEIQFKVDFIQISLLKCTTPETMGCNKLIDVIGKSLNFTFSKNIKGINLVTTVHSLTIEDFIERSDNPEFKYLVSSDSDNISTKSNHLFTLRYKRVGRIVSYNSKLIEVFDQDVNMDMKMLKLILTPKSLLTLLNFAIFTFTDPNAPEIPADMLRHNSEDTELGPQKINLQLNMEGMLIIFNDESIKLATLTLSAGSFEMYLLPESMNLNLKLDGFELTDELNESFERTSVFRQLVSMDGKNLAELNYQTFDSATNEKDYNSFLKLVTGSMHVNFNESSFQKLMNYFYKFQKMKTFFDSARQAAYNQAPSIETVNDMKMDILISAPLIRFPKISNNGPNNEIDVFEIYLGEFFVKNNFITNAAKVKTNNIRTGVRESRMSSILNLTNGEEQHLYMVHNMALIFDIIHSQGVGENLTKFNISSYFDPLEIKATELQLAYLVNVINAVQNTFTATDDTVINSPEESFYANVDEGISSSADINDNTPSLSTQPAMEETKKDIEFHFTAPEIALTFFEKTQDNVTVDDCSLTKIMLQDIGVALHLTPDSELKGTSHITSFTLEDTRNIEGNHYRQLIQKSSEQTHQFFANISRQRIENGMLTSIFSTISSPKFILAMDHVIALKNYVNSVNKLTTSDVHKQIKVDYESNNMLEIEESSSPSNDKFQYSINIIDTSVILLADPTDIDSDAVVFSVGQFLLAAQNLTNISANNVGLFLTKLNSEDDYKLRVLDDFSSSLTIDQRDSTAEKLLTLINFSIEPLIMRISLRDIRLAMSIFNRAVSLLEEKTADSEQAIVKEEEPIYEHFSKEFERKLSKYAPSLLSSISSISKPKIKPAAPDIILRAEKFEGDIGGLRLILMGDVHEMPIFDYNVNSFTISAKDWSTDLDAISTFETYVNVFNYSRSSWEPLVEAIPISIHLSKGVNQEASLILDVISRKIADVTLSSRCISMLSQIPRSLTADVDLTSRGLQKPYLLINDTGFDLSVWIKATQNTERNGSTVLKNGERLPWEFEDWKNIREKLDTDNKKSVLGVSILNSNYTTTLSIDATYEGELLHLLKPAVNHVHNRIITELKCAEDNIKMITFRSTMLLENNTHTGFEVLVEDTTNGETITLSIGTSESRSIPVNVVYNANIRIRPMSSINFEWSKKKVTWRDLLDKPVSFRCISKDDASQSFFVELNGKFDSNEPLAKIYPHMRVTISPSLIIENLLPCDINFCLFSKKEDMKTFKFLKEKEETYIHHASLDDFLLLSVQPLLENNPLSKSSIVNTPLKSALKPENILSLVLDNGQSLQLVINYQTLEGTRTKLLRIYSPYIILNRTDRDLYIQRDLSNIAQSKITDEEGKRKSAPKMFSFEQLHNKNNRAMIKFRETEWSIPLSFDAVGQTVDTTLAITNKEQEYNLGLNITEGHGAFALSTIIEVTPRFIFKNGLSIPIEICEAGSVNIQVVEPQQISPLYKLRNVLNKKICIKLVGQLSDWSPSFFINDIGITYLKVLQENNTHMLLKIEIVLQGATVFIQLKDGDNKWPFSIRNFSDYEFIFYQRDIKLIDDYYENDPSEDVTDTEYTPLYYRVPPRSVMPYAWDYPAARQKKVIITSRGRKREIQLAEIGNLKPMRLPGGVATEAPVIVDLNVVADGPTQALVITNYNPEVSLYKERSQQASSTSLSSSNEGFEADDEDKNIRTKVVIQFEGIGISLINDKLQELLYINAKGIEFRYNESDLYNTYSWKLKWLQIDNQLFGSVFPNILFPTAIPNTERDMENHPVFSGSISRVKDDTHGVPYFKHVTCLLQEFSICLDEDFIYALIEFGRFPGAPWDKEPEEEDFSSLLELPQPKDIDVADDIYFEIFHIQPTLLHLSFARTERLNTANDQPTELGSLFFINMLTMAIGNVNDAPIKLNSLYMDNVRVPLPVLISSMKTHYSQQFFYQIHKILGSADFLGNPVGLFNTISSGVWDLFYEPYQGYMMNDRPQEIGIHLAKGGASFAKKTVFGLSDSMAKLTSSVAKGLSVTQDSSFQEARRLQQRINSNSRSVFATSAQSFATTLGSGFSGVALDPYKAAQKEGASGFFKGLGKGLIGLPTKTAIGFLDLTSNLSQGVKSTTTVLDLQTTNRIRLPRYVDYDQIIRCYRLRDAQGQYWLKTANGGLFMNDRYLAHVILPGKELVVIISMQRIAEIRLATQEVMWSTSYPCIQGITLERDGIYIKLKSQSEYFIPISDSSVKKSIYKNISTAVIEYNKSCEAVL